MTIEFSGLQPAAVVEDTRNNAARLWVRWDPLLGLLLAKVQVALAMVCMLLDEVHSSFFKYLAVPA